MTPWRGIRHLRAHAISTRNRPVLVWIMCCAFSTAGGSFAKCALRFDLLGQTSQKIADRLAIFFRRIAQMPALEITQAIDTDAEHSLRPQGSLASSRVIRRGLY